MLEIKIPKGTTATIYAPYNCTNNCPFCVNKREYESKSFNMDAILESIILLSNIDDTRDFVVTGGEPLADLNSLQKILDTIYNLNQSGATHKVFINTTLPILEGAKTIIDFLNKNKNKITGINVSRHLKPYISHYMKKEDLYKINLPIRINCVLYQDDIEGLADYLEEFKDFNIQFRQDYNFVTKENLFNFDSVLFKAVKEIIKTKIGKELIVNSKNNFRWNASVDCDNGTFISFHRTLPYSSEIINDTKIIGDLIIDTDGTVYDDWNEYGKPL